MFVILYFLYMLCCVWSEVRDGIEWVKIKENNGGNGEDLTKKNSQRKVSIMTFGKKMGTRENGAFHVE